MARACASAPKIWDARHWIFPQEFFVWLIFEESLLAASTNPDRAYRCVGLCLVFARRRPAIRQNIAPQRCQYTFAAPSLNRLFDEMTVGVLYAALGPSRNDRLWPGTRGSQCSPRAADGK